MVSQGGTKSTCVLVVSASRNSCVKSALKHRHITTLARCKVCLAADEDMYHALIKCTHAKMFWSEARDWLNVKLPDLHTMTWPQDILCDPRFEDSEHAKIIIVMWAIWTSRNNITHEKTSTDPSQSMKMTRETLALLDITIGHAKILPGHGWRKPEAGWKKINNDASISSIAHMAGMGGVARSSTTSPGA